MSLPEPIQICRDLNPTVQPRLPVSQLWAHCLLLGHVFWLLATVSALGRLSCLVWPRLSCYHCVCRGPAGIPLSQESISRSRSLKGAF